MGIINHNAVVATTWNENEVLRIKEWVKSLDEKTQAAFLFGPRVVNGYATVILVPDGSKEGWDESTKGDVLRSRFTSKLEESNHNDGSSPWDYVEIGYGEFGQKVLQGNCRNCYTDAEYAEE